MKWEKPLPVGSSAVTSWPSRCRMQLSMKDPAPTSRILAPGAQAAEITIDERAVEPGLARVHGEGRRKRRLRPADDPADLVEQAIGFEQPILGGCVHPRKKGRLKPIFMGWLRAPLGSDGRGFPPGRRPPILSWMT